MSNPLTRRVAELVRETYISEVRTFQMQRTGQPSHYTPGARWDGGFDSEGKKQKPIWPEIAKRVVRYNLDPEAFVRRQFQVSRKVPWPNTLLSDAAIANYHKFADQELEEIKDAFESQTNSATTEVAVQLDLGSPDELAAWVVTLFSERTLLTALYRYCIARRLRKQYPQDPRIRQVLELYREAATVQYLRSPAAYDSVWGDLLPKGFCEKARQRQHKGVEVTDGRK